MFVRDFVKSSLLQQQQKKYLSLKIIKKPSTLALTLSKKTLVLTLLWTWNDGWDNIMLDTEWMNEQEQKKSQVVWHKNQPFSEMWADQVSLSPNKKRGAYVVSLCVKEG